MSRQTVLRRLQVLESAGHQVAATTVVIYNSESGEPLTPIGKGSRVQIWLPHNGREVLHGQRLGSPAESA